MRIFSNSAMSLDGKLATSRHDHVALGSEEDRRWMGVLRAQADAVLVGGSTWRNWALPLVEPEGPHSAEHPILNVVLTRSGEGPRKGRFFQENRTLPLILGGPGAALEGFDSRARVHRAPSSPELRWALGLLGHDYSVQNLLIEAGGDLLFQLLEEHLLDEMYVTLCPWVVGGRDATTLVDGRGFQASEMRGLSLLETRQVGQELFLHYKVERA